MEIFYICFKKNRHWVAMHDPSLTDFERPDRIVKVIDHESYRALNEQTNKLIRENNVFRLGLEDWKRQKDAETFWQFLKRKWRKRK